MQILYRFACRSLSKSSIAAPSTPGAPLLFLTPSPKPPLPEPWEYRTPYPPFSTALAPPLPMTLTRSSQFLPETLVDQHEHITNDPTPSLHPHYRSIITTTSRSAGASPAPSRHDHKAPSPVSRRRSRPGSRRLHAGHRLTSNTDTPPDSSQGTFKPQF